MNIQKVNRNNISLLNIIVILSSLCFCLLVGFYHVSNSKSSGPEKSFDVRFVEKNLNSMDQNHPDLIQYTRKRFLTPPSKQKYNLQTNAPSDMMTPAAEFALSILGKKTRGKFIEVGASDGEADSNTIYMEKYLKWTGVLIVCNPALLPNLTSKHRKAWIANVCLSPKRTPGIFNFSLSGEGYTVGTIGSRVQYKPLPTKYFDVQTMPLYTILAALGWEEIDFFSFDTEGVELEVLKTIPFDKLEFKVIAIDVFYYENEEKNQIKAILAAKGYVFVKHEARDYYFVRKSLAYKVQ